LSSLSLSQELPSHMQRCLGRMFYAADCSADMHSHCRNRLDAETENAA
jgi:hypothetical protein